MRKILPFTIFSARGVFFLAFFYALSVGLLIQLVLLPFLMPALHAGHGLMKGADWVFFHQSAVLLADRILNEGWVVWELRPELNAPIGIAAATYVLTGISEPWVLMPMNAGLFAVGAICLYVLFSYITSSRLAFFAILPYLFFPSAAAIYGQIHKDVFSIAGSLLICLVWTRFAVQGRYEWSGLFGQLVFTLTGAMLIWVVRPYLLKVVFAASTMAALLLFIRALVVRGPFRGRHTVQWWVGMVLCLLILAVSIRYSGPILNKEVAQKEVAQKEVLAKAVNNVFFEIGRTRRGFATGYPNAGSNIDTDLELNTAADVFGYIPRSLQIGLFAPFPEMWVSPGASPGGTGMRLIAGLEMSLAYLLLPGLFLIFVHSDRRYTTGIVLIWAVIAVITLSLAVCNVGTLYRMRYGYWQVLIGLGVIGWGMSIQRWRDKMQQNRTIS